MRGEGLGAFLLVFFAFTSGLEFLAGGSDLEALAYRR